MQSMDSRGYYSAISVGWFELPRILPNTKTVIQVNDISEHTKRFHDGLSALYPRKKSVFFEAVWSTCIHDKKLTACEAQYLRAVSEALEIPLPPTAVRG
jgi:hypothetical protein